MADSDNDRLGSILDEAASAAGSSYPESAVYVEETTKRRVQAGQVNMARSSAGIVQARAVRMEESAAAGVQASVVDAKASALALTVAREVRLTDVNSPLLIANRVDARNTRALVIFAWRVDGHVESAVRPWMFATFLTALAAVWFGMKWVRSLSSRKVTATGRP